MSRIGKKPIAIPKGVQVNVENKSVQVKGPKEALSLKLPKGLKVDLQNEQVIVSIENVNDPEQKKIWGTIAANLTKMLVGVTTGFTKELEIQGVGYNWTVEGQKLTLKVGFSHPVVMEIPKGITGKAVKNILTLTGADRELLGNFAATIRKVRPPEPYKGKGIRYVGEYVRRKSGKQAVSAGG